MAMQSLRFRYAGVTVYMGTSLKPDTAWPQQFEIQVQCEDVEEINDIQKLLTDYFAARPRFKEAG